MAHEKSGTVKKGKRWRDSANALRLECAGAFFFGFVVMGLALLLDATRC